MNKFAIDLVIGSTFMHAGWNLLARGQRSETAFFRRMLEIIVLVGFVPAAWSEAAVQSLTPRAWLYVCGSGFFCGLYLFCLALAYEASDFTTVYPVARALPVFLVAVGDVLLGRHPNAFGWTGMLLVICGCFLAPLYSLRGFRLRLYFNRASLWMLLTALGTVGYTLLDKFAAEVILAGPATAARYGYVYFLITYCSYLLFLRVFYKNEPASKATGWKLAALAAGLNFGAYWLVLWAYQLSRQVSYIVAFRQFSIVIGVTLGFAIYKEQGVRVRLCGTSMITAGLVLIALWG